MDKPYKCEQCGAELTADEFVSGGHAVPECDDDGYVCGQYLCGPVEIDTVWATARIAELEAKLAEIERHKKEAIAKWNRRPPELI